MMTDSDLVAAYRKGDQQAFEELYARYVRRLYDFAYIRTHNVQVAEDIVSQTFLQALEHIRSFHARRGTFSAWIYRIARNLIVDHYRRLHPTESIEDAWDLPSDSNTELDADATMNVDRIRTLLSGLTQKQRDTVLLRLWHGRTFAEIAEILDTTEAASKMTYKRTIESLQQSLLPLFFLLSSLSSS